jgi:B12-binding domain/radical SAM domain protein
MVREAVAFPVYAWLTRYNAGSVASVLSVLEAEVPRGLVEARLLPRGGSPVGPALVLLSFTTRGAASAAAEVARWRQGIPGPVWVVAGGCHASACPEETLRAGFDWVVVGEAGVALAGLCRAVAEGRPPPRGVVKEGPPPPLDTYPPWPTSGLVFSPVEITRGCPMACTFCQTPRLLGRVPRHRSLPALERVFRHAVATGHRYTRFVAPNALGYGADHPRNPLPHAVEGLLAMARTCGFGSVFLGTFPSEVRPESVTPELLNLVRDHCDNRTLAMGLQSGSEEVLRRLQRGHTVAEGVAAVARAAQAGFRPLVDFIFGLPGETEEDQSRTRDVVRHVVNAHGARVHAHVFEPLPGTPLAHAAPAPLSRRTVDLLGELTGEGKAQGSVGTPALTPCPSPWYREASVRDG